MYATSASHQHFVFACHEITTVAPFLGVRRLVRTRRARSCGTDADHDAAEPGDEEAYCTLRVSRSQHFTFL